MKHEKFKAFSNQEDGETFLKDTNIIPKSISIIDDEKVSVMIIGYEVGEKKHTYGIETHIIENVLFHGFEKAMLDVEDLATSLNGVICQDVLLNEEGDLVVVFLTAIDPE